MSDAFLRLFVGTRRLSRSGPPLRPPVTVPQEFLMPQRSPATVNQAETTPSRSTLPPGSPESSPFTPLAAPPRYDASSFTTTTPRSISGTDNEAVREGLEALSVKAESAVQRLRRVDS